MTERVGQIVARRGSVWTCAWAPPGGGAGTRMRLALGSSQGEQLEIASLRADGSAERAPLARARADVFALAWLRAGASAASASAALLVSGGRDGALALHDPRARGSHAELCRLGAAADATRAARAAKCSWPTARARSAARSWT